MTVICPTVTAYEPHEYREQIERIVPFAARIHIDLMDGVFTETKSPGIDQTWLPEGATCDVHLMYQSPRHVLSQLIELRPSMIVLQAEADDIGACVTDLKQASIRVGVALLADTAVDGAADIIKQAHHVLIFSGHLGHHGGHADLRLLEKVAQIKELNPTAEIGWDGGVNAENAAHIAGAGVDVLNVGGFIQGAANPDDAYAILQTEIETQT